jgi:hypothetical protein
MPAAEIFSFSARRFRRRQPDGFRFHAAFGHAFRHFACAAAAEPGSMPIGADVSLSFSLIISDTAAIFGHYATFTLITLFRHWLSFHFLR